VSARQALHHLHGLLADLAPDACHALADAYRADAAGEPADEEDALRELGGAMYRALVDIRDSVVASSDDDRARDERRAARVAKLPDDVVRASMRLLFEMEANENR
jgi:hypothetical protein